VILNDSTMRPSIRWFFNGLIFSKNMSLYINCRLPLQLPDIDANQPIQFSRHKEICQTQLDQLLLSEESRGMAIMQIITMQVFTRAQSCPNCQRFFDQNQEGCQVPNNVCMRYVPFVGYSAC
jgi:hypothetical protein